MDQEPKISLSEALIVGAVPVFFDVFEIVLLFFALDDFFIFDTIYFPASWLYFRLRGVSAISSVVGNVLEMIPYIGWLPLRTASFIMIVWADHHPRAAGEIMKVAKVTGVGVVAGGAGAVAGKAGAVAEKGVAAGAATEAAGARVVAGGARAAEGGVVAGGGAEGPGAASKTTPPRTRGVGPDEAQTSESRPAPSSPGATEADVALGETKTPFQELQELTGEALGEGKGFARGQAVNDNDEEHKNKNDKRMAA
ncbi:MAG: hypothetical protein AAB867_03400 [Patescibacteria group bacterium]